MNSREWERDRYQAYQDLYWDQTQGEDFRFDFDVLMREIDDRVPFIEGVGGAYRPRDPETGRRSTARYYVKNRDEINQRARKKYETDPVYREKVKARARAYQKRARTAA